MGKKELTFKIKKQKQKTKKLAYFRLAYEDYSFMLNCSWGVMSLQASNFIKKTSTQVFSCKYCEIFKNSFFMEHLQWLLLKLGQIRLTLQK